MDLEQWGKPRDHPPAPSQEALLRWRNISAPLTSRHSAAADESGRLCDSRRRSISSCFTVHFFVLVEFIFSGPSPRSGLFRRGENRSLPLHLQLCHSGVSEACSTATTVENLLQTCKQKARCHTRGGLACEIPFSLSPAAIVSLFCQNGHRFALANAD